MRRKLARVRATFDGVMYDLMRSRAAAGASAASARPPGGGARQQTGGGHEDVRNELVIIFLAGHETTVCCCPQLPQAGEAKLHVDAVLGGRAPAVTISRTCPIRAW